MTIQENGNWDLKSKDTVYEPQPPPTKKVLIKGLLHSCITCWKNTQLYIQSWNGQKIFQKC